MASLGLPGHPVEMNRHNTGPIHRLASRFAKGLEPAKPGLERLEREVVILGELDASDARPAQRMCVGATMSEPQHLVPVYGRA